MLMPQKKIVTEKSSKRVISAVVKHRLSAQV